MSSPENPAEAPPENAVIVTVQLPDVDDTEHTGAIAELGRLLKTLGYHVVGVVTQRRKSLRAGTVLGQGKLNELARYTGGTGIVPTAATHKITKARERYDDAVLEEPELPEAEALDDDEGEGEVVPLGDANLPKAAVVVVDNEITTRQARNLELATGADVLDRTGVIVEIFHRHAQTREARLQVEIARLRYVVPRLRAGVSGGGDRQRGGVGGRGAGESALELDRRKVRDRIAQLRQELAEVERDDDHRRARRSGQRRVGLVGYTNAGKSSLMRGLTGSQVLVEDKLFATLGTTVRALHPEVHPRILISDTVGFIKKLPHDLVASFRSTLDEALEASLLLHVVDASDDNYRSQLETTRSVLAEIGADAVASRVVLNKIDQVPPDRARFFQREFPEALLLSAHQPEDVAALRRHIIEFFDGALEERELFVPYTRGALVGEVHAQLEVLSERYDERGVYLSVRATPQALARLESRLASS